MAVEYPKTDREFELWRDEHPDGYIVNLSKNRNRKDQYAVLHRATCRTFRVPYVEKSYDKGCAENEFDLENNLLKDRGHGFSKRCSYCN